MTTLPLSDRVILITGASRGIGYHAAFACAQAGAHIIAMARTQGGLEDLDDAIADTPGGATLVPFDLKNPEGLEQLSQVIAERWGRLDGLLSCAAMLGDITPTPQIDDKSFDECINVNVTANHRLITRFGALLRQSPSGRAVFMTSSVSANGRAYWGTYAASKGALEGLVNSYAQEVEQTPLQVCLMDPGGVATKMRAKAFPGENADRLPQPGDIAPMIVSLLSPDSDINGRTLRYRNWSQSS